LSVFDSGSTQLTGSIFWDSEKNHWIYSNPSGSSYNSAMLMNGPRNTGSLGDEQGTLSNYVMKGQGGDHITSSQIIDDGTTVRMPGNLQVTGSLSGSSATFSSLVTISSDSGGSALRLIGRAAGDSSAIRFFANNNSTQNARIESNSSEFEINSISSLPITFKTADTTRLTIASTGAATFSSSVTATQSLILNGTNPNFDLQNSGTSRFRLELDGSNFTYLSTIGANDMILRTNATARLTLNGSTGAATFSSSVTATNCIINEASANRGGLYPYNRVLGSGTDYSVGIFSEGEIFLASGGSTTKRFTMSTTGAATFSSSVSSTQLIVSTASDANAITAGVFSGTNNPRLFIKANDSNNTVSIASASSTGSDNLAIGVGGGTNLYIKAGGNVGIGTTTTTNGLLSLRANSSDTVALVFQPTGSQAPSAISNFLGTNQTFTVIGSNAYVTSAGNIARFNTSYAGCFIAFDEGEISFGVGTNGVTPSQKMRISTTGIVNISSSVANLFLTSVTNSDSSGEGIITNLNSSSSGKTFFAGYSTSDSAYKFLARSNGGLANFQANDVNLSDERTKKDIIPLESYWDKFKAIEIVKYKYKNQTHDDFNIGVIAQQVELVAPEFVDIDGFGETPEDGIPYKTIYTSDLHHTTIKVLQECMAKIEEQQAQIEELTQKVNALENK